jgi:prepilin-type processing-associated H-X9-DG protein
MKLPQPSAEDEARQHAFTRTDLLVIVITFIILTATFLPVLARTRVKPQGTQCLYNLQQITLAWQMYADDSNNKLAPNHGAFPPNPDYSGAPIWVSGNMAGGTVGAPYTGISDPTNLALLVDPKFSTLGPYVKNPSLYRCPADQSTWYGQPRVRSYSMNAGIGCALNGTHQDPGHSELGHWLSGAGNTSPYPWQTYIRTIDITGTLAPSDLFILLDEHPNSINDASFAMAVPKNPADTRWVDLPTKYHANGCDFSFADGHAEFHKWQNPGAIPPIVWEASNGGISGSSAIPGNQDVNWLAHRTTCLQPGVQSAGIYQP